MRLRVTRRWRAVTGFVAGIGMFTAFAALPQPALAATTPVTTDYNDDGFDDIAIGMPQASVDAAGGGAVTVAAGAASGGNGGTKTTLTQDGTAGGVALPGGSEDGDAFGAATAWGDINGDGFADLAVSAPGEDGGGTGETDIGSVTVLYGTATGLRADATMFFAPVDARISGDQCGQAVSVGDYNADGKADVLAFCPGSGTVWYLDGATRTVRLPDAQPQSAARAAATTSTTDAVSADLDKDGYTDAVLTFTQFDGTHPLYVLPGSAGGLTTETIYALPDAGGASLAVGDLNGDSYPDIVAGRPHLAAGGLITAYYGGATSLTEQRSTTLDQNSANVPNGDEAGDEFGASVAAGDIDGNGFDDVLAGAPGEDVAGSPASVADAGITLVLPGSSIGVTGTGSYEISQDSTDMTGASETGDRLGTAAALPDSTGDGRADFAVGASGENTGGGMILHANSNPATGRIAGTGSAGPGAGTYGVPADSRIGDVLAP